MLPGEPKVAFSYIAIIPAILRTMIVAFSELP